MSMWDLFYNDTVTLYNGYVDENTGREIWFPTLLTKVNLVETEDANRTKSGTNEADKVKLFVSKNSCDKPILSPKEWLKSNDKDLFITFNPERDFFVKGNKTSDPYNIDSLFEYMKESYDNVYRLTTVNNYADILPHYEIGGV